MAKENHALANTPSLQSCKMTILEEVWHEHVPRTLKLCGDLVLHIEEVLDEVECEHDSTDHVGDAQGNVEVPIALLGEESKPYDMDHVAVLAALHCESTCSRQIYSKLMLQSDTTK